MIFSSNRNSNRLHGPCNRPISGRVVLRVCYRLHTYFYKAYKHTHFHIRLHFRLVLFRKCVTILKYNPINDILIIINICQVRWYAAAYLRIWKLGPVYNPYMDSHSTINSMQGVDWGRREVTWEYILSAHTPSTYHYLLFTPPFDVWRVINRTIWRP